MRDQSSTDVPAEPVEDPVLELVRRILQAGGRMRDQEVDRLAQELGVLEAELEKLWTKEPKVLDSEDDQRWSRRPVASG